MKAMQFMTVLLLTYAWVSAKSTDVKAVRDCLVSSEIWKPLGK